MLSLVVDLGDDCVADGQGHQELFDYRGSISALNINIHPQTEGVF